MHHKKECSSNKHQNSEHKNPFFMNASKAWSVWISFWHFLFVVSYVAPNCIENWKKWKEWVKKDKRCEHCQREKNSNSRNGCWLAKCAHFQWKNLLFPCRFLQQFYWGLWALISSRKGLVSKKQKEKQSTVNVSEMFQHFSRNTARNIIHIFHAS